MSELRLEPSFSSSGTRSHGLDLLWVYRFPIGFRLSSDDAAPCWCGAGISARLVVGLCPIGLRWTFTVGDHLTGQFYRVIGPSCDKIGPFCDIGVVLRGPMSKGLYSVVSLVQH